MRTVTCDCGHQMRVPRGLMGGTIKCAVCGGSIELPPDPAAGAGPPCPHCGRPWPVGEARCPSCMARSRTRAPRREEQGPAGAFSRRFEPLEPAGAAYEPPPPMDPATVRVKHWYEKPTTAGWPLAAGLTALAAAVALIVGLGADGDRGWAWAGGVAAVVAVGLIRGGGWARSILVGGLVIAGAIGAALCLWLTPEAMTVRDAAVSVGCLVVAAAGLAMMTPKHGQVGVVALGTILAVVGAVAAMVTLSDAGPDAAQRAEIARKLGGELAEAREMLDTQRSIPDDAAETPSHDAPPADQTPVDESPVDESPVDDAPEDWTPPAEPALSTPAEPVAATQPTSRPTSQPATQPAAPRTPWPEAMAAQGFSVRFPRGATVEMTRSPVTLEKRERTETCYRVDTPDLECRAVVYEGVIASADDPEHAELGRLARHVAATTPGEIEYQMWRRGKGPRVYFIRGRRREGSLQWFTRIEARRLGSRVLVLMTSHNRHQARAAVGSRQFFDSFSADADAKPAGAARD